MRRYVEPDSDNTRWEGFEFRPGDIVIAAPSKSGTTWTQLLVALLVFDGPGFPEPLGRISIWLDQTTRQTDEAHALLAAQEHRRFIKTHTPLDGVPIRDEAFYVCVGRDPRDAAVSMLHHGDNLDRERLSELVGADMPAPAGTHEERLERWLGGEGLPQWSALGLIEHYATFWERKDLPNVELFHFADYQADLPGEIERLADFLGIEVSGKRAAELAPEASIERVRDRAEAVVPEAHLGVFKDTRAFLRGGRSGDGAAEMTGGQLERYDRLVAEHASPDLARWMHFGRSA